MDFKSVVDSIATATDLKRICNAYVIDYRNLDNDEIKEALLKTAPQYYYRDNVFKTLDKLLLSEQRNDNILTPIILKVLILNTDDFKITQKELSDRVVEYQQNVINRANDYIECHRAGKLKSFEFFKFVLEVAWEKGCDVTPDEQNLLNKIRVKLNITEDEKNVIEASIGKFPTNGNKLHTRDEIESVRRKLQTEGLLFCVRDEERMNYDVIPEEVALVIREYFGIEIKKYGFAELLNHKNLKNKSYLRTMLEKSGLNIQGNFKLNELQELCIEYLQPKTLLGGYTPRDGLDNSVLSNWCAELHLPVSGQKQNLIQRIVDYYDNLRVEVANMSDERAVLFEYYEELAMRNLDLLRAQNIIAKDINCEKLFESATDYIFEEMLIHRPLVLKGTEHPDGILNFQDKLIMWDNKSKEADVNLIEHIRQFDRYIKKSEKEVAVFMVIGPSFTESSVSVAMQYMLEGETVILLITAKELKELALYWSENKGNVEPFPLGYFKQPGRFNKNLVY